MVSSNKPLYLLPDYNARGSGTSREADRIHLIKVAHPSCTQGN